MVSRSYACTYLYEYAWTNSKNSKYCPTTLRKLTIENQKSPNSKSKIIFQFFLFGFHLNFPGCTLQGINISHLGKRKIIFKMPFLGDMLVPWRVSPSNPQPPNLSHLLQLPKQSVPWNAKGWWPPSPQPSCQQIVQTQWLALPFCFQTKTNICLYIKLYIYIFKLLKNISGSGWH